MPPKKTYPPRNERFVFLLSRAEKKKVKEIMEATGQVSWAATFRMMIDKQHARIELAPPVSDKAE